MRLLANENVPRHAVGALRTKGHDVAWIRLDAPGASDRAVIDRASAEARLLVTLDKDFGELAFRSGLPTGSGVILVRIPSKNPDQLARLNVEALEVQHGWAGHFSVIERGRVRMIPLPPPPSPGR